MKKLLAVLAVLSLFVVAATNDADTSNGTERFADDADTSNIHNTLAQTEPRGTQEAPGNGC